LPSGKAPTTGDLAHDPLERKLQEFRDGDKSART
jgi:hypothetical protein